jgi:DeoR family transcriptional regulator, suf operon transcriptional repressor
VDPTPQPRAATTVQTLGERQQAMLRLLLQEKEGLTVDQLVAHLSITRTAVRQHLAALERDGYIHKDGLKITGGRPGFLYSLTAAGAEIFPKQYAWFSALLLQRLRQQLGHEGLVRFMRDLAAGVAAGLGPRVDGRGPEARVMELVLIMNDLGYDARTPGAKGAPLSIVATNCVYHQLAEAFPEVCEFDLGLLELVAQLRVRHTECMVRGGRVCRFLLEGDESANPDPD